MKALVPYIVLSRCLCTNLLQQGWLSLVHELVRYCFWYLVGVRYIREPLWCVYTFSLLAVPLNLILADPSALSVANWSTSIARVVNHCYIDHTL